MPRRSPNVVSVGDTVGPTEAWRVSAVQVGRQRDLVEIVGPGDNDQRIGFNCGMIRDAPHGR